MFCIDRLVAWLPWKLCSLRRWFVLYHERCTLRGNAGDAGFIEHAYRIGGLPYYVGI